MTPIQFSDLDLSRAVDFDTYLQKCRSGKPRRLQGPVQVSLSSSTPNSEPGQNGTTVENNSAVA